MSGSPFFTFLPSVVMLTIWNCQYSPNAGGPPKFCTDVAFKVPVASTQKLIDLGAITNSSTDALPAFERKDGSPIGLKNSEPATIATRITRLTIILLTILGITFLLFF